MMDDALLPDDLGPMAPAMPQAPAVPWVSSFLPEPNTAQKIAPAVIAALALALGPKRGGGGLAAGYAQGQNRVDQRNLQIAQSDHADAIRQQAMQQQALKQQAAAEQAHQQRLMAAKLTIKQQLAGVRDKGQYDQAIDGYANLLMQSGYRVTPNQLRLEMPFVAPSAKQIAGDAVNAWLKNPANAEAVKRDPLVVSKVMLRIDTNGDGIAENVPLLRAGELGGVQFATDANGQVVGSVKADEKIGTQFQELLSAKRARFLAENKREPTPKEQEALVTAALREGSEAQRKPAGSKGDLTPGQSLMYTRQLRNDFSRETQAARTVAQQLALMKSSIAAVKAGSAPAGSQGVLVTFQKILDPNSVVRESEYARSAAGQSLLARIEGKFDQLKSGGAGIPVAELDAFVKLAEQFAAKQAASAREVKNQIDAIAGEYGLNPALITRDLSEPEPQEPQPDTPAARAAEKLRKR